jgi:hypothetical protein
MHDPLCRKELGVMKRLATNWQLVSAAAMWIGGLGFAAGLAYALNRPLEITPEPVAVEARNPTIADDGVAEASLATRSLEVAPVPIATHPHPRPAVAPPVAAPPPPRNFDDMKCAGWRDLQMGSGRVQVCE